MSSAHSDSKDDSASLQPYATCSLPTGHGLFQVDVYRDAEDAEHLLISLGDLDEATPLFVRIHSECFTGEVLSSLKCDCQAQLESALGMIRERGRGAVVYLRQEGRGIGLGNKIRAYAEQEKGADTIEANRRIGFDIDLRDYAFAASILHARRVRKIILNTNNPDKVRAIQDHGFELTEVVPSTSRCNPHNEAYLRTKFEGMGHRGLDQSLRNPAG